MVHPKFPVRSIPGDLPENAISEHIIMCAMAVHREPGPGLRVCEEAMDIDCSLDGLAPQRPVCLLINFNPRLVKEGLKRLFCN